MTDDDVDQMNNFKLRRNQLQHSLLPTEQAQSHEDVVNFISSVGSLHIFMGVCHSVTLSPLTSLQLSACATSLSDSFNPEQNRGLEKEMKIIPVVALNS